ncbi:hypothetical protein, partial [Burkholderia sp. SIMBA_024]|uniref:hypothetical protein n=1 Tax=Burkholderia sp. SIMBA_024 TaxID=3085768 RepID=UPI00397D8610
CTEAAHGGLAPSDVFDKVRALPTRVPRHRRYLAAIAAGLAHVDREEVCVLAADTPRAVEAVALLRAHPTGDADGTCLADADGVQWLIGRY